jgi:diguanylate cyclase (GGDEF)-like protein
VEIQEYRWMKKGLALLQAGYPYLRNIDGLTLPMVGSPELITCDNTIFDQSRNDNDRKGLIQLVPFYGSDGAIKGAVAAIMRSNAYRALLPNADYALVNTVRAFATRPLENGQESQSASWVQAGKPDPGLIYSETVPVRTADTTSTWMVWAGHPNAAFETSAEADSVRKSVLTSFGGIAILVAAALGVCFMVGRSLKAGALANARLEARVAERTAEIEFLAAHDELTGLVNRNQLTQRLNDALLRVKPGEHLAVLALDIDHFKEVNDTLGHPAGDLLLKEFASRIQNVVREHDVIARFGGDEFIVVQLMVAEPQHTEQLARKAIESIAYPFDLGGHSTIVGVSVGIAMAPLDGKTAEHLLRNADIALYRAKGDGRGTCRFFEAEMDAALQARREQERDLRRALVAKEFVLHYQPLVSAATNDVTGFEALIRWNHPVQGLLSPGEFIPLAEEIGLIGPIGDWVLEEACRDAAGWPSPLKVAVNLSPVQFSQQTLSHAVVAALDNSGLAPFRLELELTESALLINNEQTLKVLHQFKALGVRIAMDDFGTGFSSLSYLRSFPFDRIKIDRSFLMSPETRTVALSSTPSWRWVKALG